MVDLPPADTKRWVASRKAAVIAGLRAGAITTKEACQRYALSQEELLGWQRAFEADGMRGLCATRLRGQRRQSAQHDEPC